MQSKQFSLYDKSAAQSVVGRPCVLTNIDGNYGGSGSEYLQIFDKATAAVANDVPIASFLLSAAGPLPSIFETIAANVFALGLSVGISTVNEKYTASASAFDIFGAYEEIEIPASGTTLVTSTAFDTFTQLANPTTGALPIYLKVTGQTHTRRWLHFFGAIPAEGDVAVRSWPMFTSDGAAAPTYTAINPLILSFGNEGGRWFPKSATGTSRPGLYWAISTTELILTTAADMECTWTSYYKAL